MAGLTSCYIIPWPDSSLGRNMYCQSTKAGWISLTGCPLSGHLSQTHMCLCLRCSTYLSRASCYPVSSGLPCGFLLKSSSGRSHKHRHTHSLDSKHNGVWDPPPPQRTLVTGTCRITSAVISAVEACVFGASCLPTPHLSNDKAMLC